MKKCSREAWAQCPDRFICEPGAVFQDGTWCDEFNARITDTPARSRADRIRGMTDEELADELLRILWDGGDSVSESFCQARQECRELVDTDEGIPDEMCRACLLRWLGEPA